MPHPESSAQWRQTDPLSCHDTKADTICSTLPGRANRGSLPAAGERTLLNYDSQSALTRSPSPNHNPQPLVLLIWVDSREDSAVDGACLAFINMLACKADVH
jgi:hypothetical protein